MRPPRSRDSAGCNKPKQLLSPIIAICFVVWGQGEVSWAGQACLSNPCVYGICLDDVNGTFSCYCIDGYTGFLCQTNWDECWSDPCLNGGVCVDGIAHFNCTCPPGFQGKLCEQNVDECFSNPCRNNGTCVDGPNGYTCICPSGYLGNACETDISVCNDTQEIRCLNGGVCMEGPGFTFNCVCPHGWSGEFCQEATDECVSSPCFNGGVCTDLHANYSCVCPFGFSGRNCEVELEMCGDRSPCQNGALCLVEDWLRVCYCVPDFHGDRCQFQYNECLLGPGCANNGTCIDGVDGYNCSCPPGWSGQFCECKITSDDEIDCNQFPPVITPTQKQTPTVPISTANEVPNTSLYQKPSSTTQIPSTKPPKFYYSIITECIPVWILFSMKPSETTTGISVQTKKTAFPGDWFTRVVPTQGTQTKPQEVKTTKPTVPETKSTLTTVPITTEITSAVLTTQKTPVTKIVTQIIPTLPITPITTTTSTSTTTTTQTPQTTTLTTPTTTTTTQTTPTTTTTTTQTTPTTTTTTTIQTTPTTITTTQTTPTSTTTQMPPTTTTVITTTETTPTTEITLPTTTTTTETTSTSTKTTTPSTVTTTTEQTTVVTTEQTTSKPTTIRTEPTTRSITTTTTEQTTPPVTTTAKQTTITTTTEQTTHLTTEKTIPTTQIFTTTSEPTTKTTETTTTTTQTQPTTSKNLTISETTPDSTQPSSTTSPSIPLNCTRISCKNGGICVNTTSGPRCICKSSWEGPFCSSKTDIKVVGLSGKSFLSHRLTNTHSIKIDVTARTISPTGIILYSHLGSNIFMSLYLEDGLLKFKFSCGIQTMLLSEVQFHVNNGYDLVAAVTLEFFPPTRDPVHCTATVRVNNTLAMSGEQMAKGPHADSGYAWVYVGGIPTRYIYKDEVPISKGFIGCLQNLRIDNSERGIFKDSFESDEITECKSLACLSNPCRSGSTCAENNNKWVCHCPPGFLGRMCERSVCSNNPCEFGGTCVPFPGSGFICLCPSGKQGLFCETDAETGYPLFASSIGGLSTFAAYLLPTEISQDLTLTFKFLPHDKEQISLMIFIGQDGYHRATSDHLAVSFIKGYVVLTWNLGSGPRRIFTKHPVASTGRSFHTVQIGKVGQRAWLAVDNQQNVTGKSPGKLTQLNAKSVIFLGGHESKNFSLLPHDLPLHTGFSGCLFDVELRTGQMLIKVEKTRPAFSRGVGQCGRTLCQKHSCENGGGCIHHGATFTCLCTEGWFGPTCSLKYNPCDSTRHNCSSGSTCVPQRHGFHCDCPVGRRGKYCEISEELSDVKFTGVRSYLALPVGNLNTLQYCIDLEIRPLAQYGLLLYFGKPESNSFWSLSVQDGHLELRISPEGGKRGGEVLVIKSRKLLTEGKWHRIRTGRYGRRLYLWVDGFVSTGILLPGENISPSGSIAYIGGVPDLSEIPVGVAGKVLTPFRGCVRKFMSQWKRVQLTKANILEGRNLEDCDGTVCGGDVCENGGTCHIQENNEPFCECLKEYLGKRCEYRISCKEINCQNGGRCSQEKSLIPQCHCPNGWGGPFCEAGVAVKAPQFRGDSYIMIDRVDMGNVKRRDTRDTVIVDFIHLSFTTTEPNGMLLWSSQENETEFVGIGVENKKIKVVLAWTDRDAITFALEKDVADGAWHDLTVTFDSSNLTISLDKEAIHKYDENIPDYPLATDGRFFLGGFPSTRKVFDQTSGHFLTGFDGCLQKLAWHAQSEISNFSKFAGENIRACDTFE